MNKYHYALNNPCGYVDPNSHTPCCVTDDELKVAQAGAENVAVGVAKAVGNIGVGIHNFSASYLGGKPVAPFQPNNLTQDVAMVVTEAVTFFAGFLGGRAQVGGVLVADTKASTTVAAELGSTQAARQLGQQGEALSGVVKNTERIPSLTGTAKYRTPDGLNTTAKTIDEVKNLSYQARTNQIRDNIAFAQQKGFTFSFARQIHDSIIRAVAERSSCG